MELLCTSEGVVHRRCDLPLHRLKATTCWYCSARCWHVVSDKKRWLRNLSGDNEHKHASGLLSTPARRSVIASVCTRTSEAELWISPSCSRMNVFRATCPLQLPRQRNKFRVRIARRQQCCSCGVPANTPKYLLLECKGKSSSVYHLRENVHARFSSS